MTTVIEYMGLPPVPEGHFYRIGPDPKMDGYHGKRWVLVEICKHDKFLWFKSVKVVAKAKNAVWDQDSHPLDVIRRAAKEARESYVYLKGEEHPSAQYFGVFE